MKGPRLHSLQLPITLFPHMFFMAEGLVVACLVFYTPRDINAFVDGMPHVIAALIASMPLTLASLVMVFTPILIGAAFYLSCSNRLKLPKSAAVYMSGTILALSGQIAHDGSCWIPLGICLMFTGSLFGYLELILKTREWLHIGMTMATASSIAAFVSVSGP